MHAHGRHRTRELKRVVRIHRDPFEPILPILEAKSPVAEYRKSPRRCPPDAGRAAISKSGSRGCPCLPPPALRASHRAEAEEPARAFGLPARAYSDGERVLEDRRRGELRWNTREGGWEVLIPAIAFKNHNSSFFGSKPFG